MFHSDKEQWQSSSCKSWSLWLINGMVGRWMNSLMSWPVTIFLASVTHCCILTEIYYYFFCCVVPQTLYEPLALYIYILISSFYLYHSIALCVFCSHIEMGHLYTDFTHRVACGTELNKKRWKTLEKRAIIKMALCEKRVSGHKLLALWPCNDLWGNSNYPGITASGE
jgi:hypothetical protein